MVCLTYGKCFYYWKNSNAINSVTFRGRIFIIHVYKVEGYHLRKWYPSGYLRLNYLTEPYLCSHKPFCLYEHNFNLNIWTHVPTLLLIQTAAATDTQYQTEDGKFEPKPEERGFWLSWVQRLFPRWQSCHIISLIPFYRRGFQAHRGLFLKCLKV